MGTRIFLGPVSGCFAAVFIGAVRILKRCRHKKDVFVDAFSKTCAEGGTYILGKYAGGPCLRLETVPWR